MRAMLLAEFVGFPIWLASNPEQRRRQPKAGVGFPD
jgi:hypothetical protein